jgi:DNA-binding NarL/FixJ family response regulator
MKTLLLNPGSIGIHLGRQMAHRIFLAVKNKLFSEGLSALLERQKGFSLVGSGLNCANALQGAKELKPDILILDSLLIEGGKHIFLRQLQSYTLCPPILWLADDPDPELADVIMGLGIKGYVLKDCDSNELVQAIRVLVAHGIYLCSQIESALHEKETRAIEQYEKNGDDSSSHLTACEHRVMVLLVEGKTNKEIGDFLGVSIKTVHAHRTQLMRKLQLHSLPALTKYAIKHGIISLN